MCQHCKTEILDLEVLHKSMFFVGEFLLVSAKNNIFLMGNINRNKVQIIEASTGLSCSAKKLFLGISQNSQDVPEPLFK